MEDTMSLGKEKTDIKLQVWVSERMKEEINDIKDKRGMSQSEVTRMLLDLGLEVHRDLSRVGIVRLVDMIYRLKTALKEIGDAESEALKT